MGFFRIKKYNKFKVFSMMSDTQEVLGKYLFLLNWNRSEWRRTMNNQTGK